MGRSFKYHRPRGCLTAGSEEPNALVELRDRRPARAQHASDRWPSLYEGLSGHEPKPLHRRLKFDIMSVNQLIGRFLTAGFYYKTFMWPAAFWEPVYEKFIRPSAAGLGRAATEPDPDSYEHAHTHCDVLIVGGWAGRSSRLHWRGRTPVCGSSSQRSRRLPILAVALALDLDRIDNKKAGNLGRQSIAALSRLENVTIMPRTTVFGYYDGNVMAALERVNDHLIEPPEHEPRQRLWTIRAKQVVLACGSQERPFVFDNNDVPGCDAFNRGAQIHRPVRGCCRGGTDCRLYQQ